MDMPYVNPAPHGDECPFCIAERGKPYQHSGRMQSEGVSRQAREYPECNETEPLVISGRAR
jgi:hypothetical protein